MRRRGGPVPYELLGRARGLPPSSEIARGESPQGVDDGSGRWGPGRTLRLPVGVVPGVAVAMVALAVLAYMWGFSRGRHDARLEAGRVLEASMASRSIEDPLADAGGSPAGPEGRASAREREGSVRSDLGGSDPARPWGEAVGAVGGDPRRAGLNYFVLAHATPETAPELAAFCRARGLEAHVVDDHNGVARKVVVVPGYVDGERRGDRVRAIEQRIVEVGLAWKSHRRGNADFSGYYAELHRGPDGGG